MAIDVEVADDKAVVRGQLVRLRGDKGTRPHASDLAFAMSQVPQDTSRGLHTGNVAGALGADGGELSEFRGQKTGGGVCRRRRELLRGDAGRRGGEDVGRKGEAGSVGGVRDKWWVGRRGRRKGGINVAPDALLMRWPITPIALQGTRLGGAASMRPAAVVALCKG